MAEFPALPLLTDAYIADTQHLTNEEHGVYLRLIMFAWRTPDCSLPDDDKRLAIMVGVTPKKWASLKPVIMKFWTLKDECWRQKKLTSQRQFVEQSRKQKRAAGIASSKAKALKNKEVASTAVVTETPTERQRKGQQSITITNTKEKKDNKLSQKRSREGEAELLTVLDEETARAVVDHRIKIRKPLTSRAAELLANQFGKCANPNEAADTMIVQGWQGFNPEWIKPEMNNGIAITPIKLNQWESIMDRYDRTKFWHQSYGPPPGEPGCEVPPELFKQSEAAE